MKQMLASILVVSAAGALLVTGAAPAQVNPQSSPQARSDPGPAVQKVSVKGKALFDFDKAAVNPDDGGKLMSEVRSMKNVTWQTISVVGHTDSVGPDSYNQALSERRAAAVQAFLIEKGVKPERIRIDGKGEAVPVADNRTSSGRAANRRADIEFQGLQSIAD